MTGRTHINPSEKYDPGKFIENHFATNLRIQKHLVFKVLPFDKAFPKARIETVGGRSKLSVKD